ncbi:DUF898 family protein [Phreatobacter sp.]|uniref:DUF898 family protein n=1 Tax=Phreatobacter sp. TaxID=1966341 RepID=UPI0022C71DA3|nr:DUF898 family protein [Phreatobacter sp.]MCZ8313981.1 DUF898 family protein [Phreatobacter sp.]
MGSPPPAAPAAAAATRMVFTGQGGELFGLLVRGYVLQVITLGLYRFWFTTEIRRYYWGHSFVGAEDITYTGRGMELFKGFLIALAVVLPIQVAAFLILLGLPQAEMVVSATVFLAYALLGQFAVYAGRRYRLTRTSFRGLRLRMTGSAWSYAFRAFGLWILVVLSLGLFYPWATASMERMKMRNTWYGDVPGDFTGSPLVLFRRGILLWLMALALPVLGVVSLIASVPPEAWDALWLWLDGSSARIPTAVGLAIAALTGIGLLTIIVPILLFPAFQAITFRWRMEGTRIGGASFTSGFTVGASYRVYLLGAVALFGVLILLGIVSAIGFGGIATVAVLRGGDGFDSTTAGVIGIVLVALAYLILFGTMWIAKQLLIDLRLQRARLASLAVVNLAALDNARANNVDASAMGDSLGSAVDFGFST